MQERIESRRPGRIWVERIVWNAAATAALALMIVVLLCSLQWLDEIDPAAARGHAELGPRASFAVEGTPAPRPTEVARVNGPSG